MRNRRQYRTGEIVARRVPTVLRVAGRKLLLQAERRAVLDALLTPRLDAVEPRLGLRQLAAQAGFHLGHELVADVLPVQRGEQLILPDDELLQKRDLKRRGVGLPLPLKRREAQADEDVDGSRAERDERDRCRDRRDDLRPGHLGTLLRWKTPVVLNTSTTPTMTFCTISSGMSWPVAAAMVWTSCTATSSFVAPGCVIRFSTAMTTSRIRGRSFTRMMSSSITVLTAER